MAIYIHQDEPNLTIQVIAADDPDDAERIYQQVSELPGVFVSHRSDAVYIICGQASTYYEAINLLLPD